MLLQDNTDRVESLGSHLLQPGSITLEMALFFLTPDHLSNLPASSPTSDPSSPGQFLHTVPQLPS